MFKKLKYLSLITLLIVFVSTVTINVQELFAQTEQKDKYYVALECLDTPTDDEVNETIKIIKNRLDLLGFSESIIKRCGFKNILIELSNMNIENYKIRSFIEAPGLLEFKDETGKTLLSGKHIKFAEVIFDSFNRPTVSIEFNEIGAEEFAIITRKNVDKKLVITLDDKEISSPVVQEPILGGKAIITGRFTVESANRLTVLLRSGALPVRVKILWFDTLVPVITWDKTFGGSGDDEAWSLIQTTDGGYAVAGRTRSEGAKDADDWNSWVINLDKQGNQVWDRIYGESGDDWAGSLIQTTDGGYAVAGVTKSVVGYTKSVGAGGQDFWVIKLDVQGNEVWDRTYGGSANDGAYSIIQTTDGGYAVAGYTKTKGAGKEDFWVIKLNKQGKMIWDRTYGGSGDDWAESLIQTTEGGYVVVGNTGSKGAGKEDFWVIKLNKQGKMIWDRTYGGIGDDLANSLIQTTDGGYAVAGRTDSKGAGKNDCWLIKLDEQGNQVWDKTYGGSNNDQANSLIQTTDGGYAIAGDTKSKGAGIIDAWIIKLDSKGDITWDKTYGGSNYDSADSLLQTTDGGYAVAGYTYSKGAGKEDFWVIKLDEQGNLIPDVCKLDYEAQTGRETTYFLKGSLHCPEKGGYPCDSCGPPPDYKNHFKGFNVLTTQEDCYVKLINQNGDYIGNQNNCEVIIKGEKWLGLENESGTKLVEEIDKGNFNFAPANKFVEKTMKIPEDGYYYEFANDGKEFRLYLSRDRVEAFNAVPWQNIIIETKNKETNKVFTYEFEKGIFPLAYSWNSGGVANYGQCVWWVAKRWAEEVDPMALFPFYPSSPEKVNVRKIDKDYQPKDFDILINYDPMQVEKLGHYGFVEKVDGDQVYITQFNWIKPGEVYNYLPRVWNRNVTNLFYSNNPSDGYYFKYYYRK